MDRRWAPDIRRHLLRAFANLTIVVSSRPRCASRIGGRRSIDAVQVRGVVAYHQPRLVFGDAGEILADPLDPKWEGALGVGIIRTPHEPIHAEQMARQDTGRSSSKVAQKWRSK